MTIANLPLALDHLTVADTTPSQLVAAAHSAGCQAMCLFMEPMDVLPRMPRFDIYADTLERRDTRARMLDLGIRLEVAYPFTLAGRTRLGDFARALDCGAFLGAQYANVLVYDRDPARRADTFGAFCELADSFGLGVVVEFFPISQVRSLAEAVALAKTVDAPGRVGVNVDLLHLMRSGGSIAELADAPPERILYGQISDGPLPQDDAKWGFDASLLRLLPGEGVFDIAGFVRALPPSCPMSVELPQDAALAAGVSVNERARSAAEAVFAACLDVAKVKGCPASA